MRFVLDTNVVISGMLFGGKPFELLNKGFALNFNWICSEPILIEYRKVLSSKKFKLSVNEIEQLMAPIIDVVEIVVPMRTIDLIKRCPGDNRILECATAGKANFIVTGDRRDLISLEKFEHVKIIQVTEALSLF